MSSRDNLSVLRARTLPRVRNRVQRASKAQIEQMLFRFWLGRLEYRGVNRTKTDTDIEGWSGVLGTDLVEKLDL